MVFPEYQDVNASEGAQTLFVYANDVTGGLFVAMMLFAFFMIILWSTYFSARRISGEVNLPASFAVAGFVTVLVAMSMSFVDGLMNLTTFVVTLVVSIIGVVWLFFSNK